ncbi:hypothetical protein DFP72DRAFT_341254 [Ephemerocybe angulata]|uniref:Uncharacterized protein n=1 Tax=Ephemerocybe angulata TaxID=980116 RepID=A0A8H6HZS3_9AGAR|nr:hypothetical protein DFP72DRAFT_341254 [Tulosesus angulatus]
MLQRGPNSLLRVVQNARASGPSISTRAPGTLLIQGMPRNYSLNTVSTVRKTHVLGSTQLLCPMSRSAVQHDVVRGRHKRIVSNLDPNCLKMSDIVDLSGTVQPSVRFGGGSGTRLHYHYVRGSHYTPFPPNSRGFLYYHSRPGLPPGAGEIRLRVADSGLALSPADLFASGRDLWDDAGHRPWRMHMLQLYTTRNYDPIRQLLLSQGLIDAAQDRETEQRVSVSSVKPGAWNILDTISDTFVIQLPIQTLNLAFIHDECIVPAFEAAWALRWRERPETVEGSDAHWRLYQELTQMCFLGSALVRFELKKAEANNMFYRVKEGEVVLVLRVVELLDQASPDGVPFRLPEGGDLIQTRSPRFYWFMHLDQARKYGIITPSSLKKLEELYLGDNTSTGKSPPC